MSRLLSVVAIVAAAAAALAAHAMPGETAAGPVHSPPETVGPNPSIQPVDKHLIPTVQVARARGWAEGEKPAAAPGVAVNAFATGLNHPRCLCVPPNGAQPGVKLTDLPAGPINHHGTKNIIASPDGSKLYVAAGSNERHGLGRRHAVDGGQRARRARRRPPRPATSRP